MGISTNPSKDLMVDQSWSICCKCGCVQLDNLIPIDKLYERGHNPAIGSTWKKHHKTFANFINQHCGSSILELGGGNCVLFEELDKLIDINSYVIYDKSCDSDDHRIVRKNNFYDPNKVDDVGVDTIIHSHTMEHFYNPRNYVESFNRLLNIGGKVIISIPDTKKLVKEKLNGINFEHSYFLCMEYLEFLMNSFGFELVESKNFNDYNIFACYEKKVDNIVDVEIDNQYEENKNIMEDYVKYNLEEIEKYNKILKNKKNTYIFGCHVTTQNLIHFGLDLDTVFGILDNDPSKQNKFLYGTGIMTFCPEVIKEQTDVCVLVRMGIYTEEIVKGLISMNPELDIIL
tara:strand:- start:956 stop:1987 length:1032 start_codon:yes stop_codon:yes gene_type:complete